MIIKQGVTGEVSYELDFVKEVLSAKVMRTGGIGDTEMIQIALPAEAVVQALFAKLPTGTLTTEVESLIIAGLKLIPA